MIMAMVQENVTKKTKQICTSDGTPQFTPAP